MPGRRLNFKMYIEGIEVPFVQIQINATANQPSQAQIAMVPTDSIYNIRPRSLVHIFFFDDYVGPEPFGKSQDSPVWRLLWEGEVVGFGFTKSPSGRSFTLRCADLSNYWASCKQYFLGGGDLGWSGAERTLFIGSKSVKLNILNEITAFYQKFFSKKAGETKSKTFPEALACMMQSFTEDLIYWETLNNRIRLSNKVVVLQDDNVEKLLKVQAFEKVIRGMHGNMGGRVSLLDFLNNLKQLIYYNHVPIVAPPFLPVDSEITSTNQCLPRDPKENPILNQLSSTDLSTGQGTLTSFLFKPNVYMSLPPRCNVLFPDSISSITFNRNFMSEPTRIRMIADHAVFNGQIFQAIFVAPSELVDNLKALTLLNNQLIGKVMTKSEREKSKESGLFQQNTKNGEIPYLMTEEEYEKGIVPLDVNLSFAKYSTLAGDKDNEELFNSMTQVAEYHLQIARSTARSLSVSMEFNPWIVVNFPCAVFDRSRSYFANVANISHMIDASGGAFTRIDGNLAKEMIIEDEEIVAIPQWLNSLYHPDKVHGESGTYAKILGCDALGPTAPGATGAAVEASVLNEQQQKTSSPKAEFGASRQFDLAAVADKVYQLSKPTLLDQGNITGEYDKIALRDDAYAFAESYRRRNVATIKQIFGEFYELGATDEHNINPPSIFPVGAPSEPSEGTEISGFGKQSSDRTSGTPFDYRPLSGRVITEGKPSVKRTRRVRRKGAPKIVPIGNLDRPGHKRDAPLEYRRETTDLSAIDGR